MQKSLLLAASLALLATPALAESKVYELTIKDHRFTPDTLEVPAGEKVKLVVKNQDSSAEEFESHDLKREKLVAAGAEITLSVGPLKAGEYSFVGEYHEDTARGKIIAK